MVGSKSTYYIKLDKLFNAASERTYPKNQLIQYQGDALSHIYLVKAGYVKVYTILDSGDMRTLLILGPGDLFPISFSMNFDWDNYSVRYFYQTLTDTRLKIMDSAQLKHKIESDPDVKNLYLEYIASTNRTILDQLEIMKSKKAINKILLLLPYLIHKLGHQIRPNVYQLKVKLSHQELADLSGVTRETTTTLIKKLEKAGKLKQQGGKLVIKAGKDKIDKKSK